MVHGWSPLRSFLDQFANLPLQGFLLPALQHYPSHTQSPVPSHHDQSCRNICFYHSLPELLLALSELFDHLLPTCFLLQASDLPARLLLLTILTLLGLPWLCSWLRRFKLLLS
jgi:hypothetical protein